MWIVKLGGSLSGAGTLERWLAAILTAGRGKIIVVPGGGPCADVVREEQQRWRFDDSCAHSMALLAMDQYGLQIASMGNSPAPGSYQVAADEDTLREALRADRIPIWLPSRWAESDPRLARNWSITSDSLALWLARRLGVTQVLLVKSAPVDSSVMKPEDLVRRGLVDDGFPSMVRLARCQIRLLGTSHIGQLADVIHNGAEIGLHVV